MNNKEFNKRDLLDLLAKCELLVRMFVAEVRYNYYDPEKWEKYILLFDEYNAKIQGLLKVNKDKNE